MVRYLSQPANSSICGPVAIINIMKFFGFNATRKSITYIKHQCGYDNGTDESGISATLKSIESFKFYIRKNPSIEKIEKHLKIGGAIIMLTVVEDDLEIFGHYWVITAKSDKKFICHNYHAKSTEYMTEEQIKETMGVSLQGMPKAWFVSQR